MLLKTTVTTDPAYNKNVISVRFSPTHADQIPHRAWTHDKTVSEVVRDAMSGDSDSHQG